MYVVQAGKKKIVQIGRKYSSKNRPYENIKYQARFEWVDKQVQLVFYLVY